MVFTRQSLLLILVALLSVNGTAQGISHDPGKLYEEFSKAYEELNEGRLAGLYTEQAELINLYDGSVPNSLKGRTSILKYFGDFFGMIRSNRQQLRISFRITDRKTNGDHIMDNGYYKLEIITPGKPSSATYGKFSTVLEAGGKGYRFKTDATTNASQAEYEQAHHISMWF